MTFGTHKHLRSLVDATPGVEFLSAGRMPMHDHQLRTKVGIKLKRQVFTSPSGRFVFAEMTCWPTGGICGYSILRSGVGGAKV